jgi:glycerate 2-kinase
LDSLLPELSDADAFAHLRALFDVAVARAQPDQVIPDAVADIAAAPPERRIVVVGAGKASAAMAQALENSVPSALRNRLSGLVVTRYGHSVRCEHIEIVEASHPVPDQAGMDAARRILGLASPLGGDDLVIALISGGGSALLTLPGEGISLADKQAVNQGLLRSGAPIDAMNCVRKHLSQIKGGHLARAIAPARLVTLAISDVPGDDPSVIASGPTVPDLTTCTDALEILKRYEIDVPDSVRRYLTSEAAETPKPGDLAFERADYRMVATPMASLEAAADAARARGLEPIILGDALEGEAHELGRNHADDALARLGHGHKQPLVLLSGGETTVTVSGKAGRGGRNAEYLLGFALAVGGRPGIHAIACDTDGIDGSEDNAGAMAGPGTLAAIRAELLDPTALLTGHDAYAAFEAADGLVVTGPTLTNVNDFRAILVSR